MKFDVFVIDLLRLIHVTANDTSDIFNTSACIRVEGDVKNMAEGFRSHLIRLIGNMCYKNKDNQDKVRLFLTVSKTHVTSFRI